MQPLVSVNIVIYNGLRWLERCFSSLFGQTYSNIEVIALDNNSTDGSYAWLTKQANEKSNMRVMRNDSNLGFAVAHNMGIRQAQGKYICLLNQDIILDSNFIKIAVNRLELQNKKIAALQGKLLKLSVDFSKTNIIDSCGLEMLRNRRIISRGQGETDKGQYDRLTDIFGVDGALPVYSKEALEDIKIPVGKDRFEYFDEDFFMYKEDVDLAWRFILFGWKSIFEPEAIAWHARGAGDSTAKDMLNVVRERLKIPNRAKFYSWKNQRLMQVKNELWPLFIKDLSAIILKEILSLGYIVIFETKNVGSLLLFFKQLPNALRKRSYIMRHQKIQHIDEIKRWFKF